MVEVKVVEKNPIIALTNDEIDILIHGVTCQGVLAVGIAREIGITFPKVDLVNFNFVKEFNKIKHSILSKFSEWYGYNGSRKYGVINLYMQVHPGQEEVSHIITRGLNNILNTRGVKKKSGKPLRYGVTLLGTEFKKLSTDKSIQIIKDCIEMYSYLKDVEVDITIYKYENS